MTDFKYNCEPCKYKTNSKQGYYQHKKTKKHKNNFLGDLEVSQKVSQKLAKVSQKLAKVSQKLAKNEIEENEFYGKCEYCQKTFKHKSSLSKHQNYRCKKKPMPNITNNITNNNITNTNTTNNNLNITLNIGSVEEFNKIKSLITPEVIQKLCAPQRMGLPRQTYDMIKNISNYSIQLKQENKELQNFKKTNVRDNLIDVYDDEKWSKEFFEDYFLKDLHKYTEVILKKCEEKAVEPDISRDEKLEIIKEVCKNYEKYKKIDEEDLDGIISFTLDAIDEQIKQTMITHYNITKDSNQ